jgi:hypothetical protein
LKTTIFLSRPCFTISPATEAPASEGTPTNVFSPSEPRITSLKVTFEPASPGRLGILIVLPDSARYCLPPVRMIA